MSDYLETLDRLIKDAQQPGWYPTIANDNLFAQKQNFFFRNSQSQSFSDLKTQEKKYSAPLSELIVARLGNKFSLMGADEESSNVGFIQDEYCTGIFFTWFFKDQYWQELATTERNYRMAVLGLPKPNTVIARFRRSPLYERNLWGVILKYADVPERFIR